MASNCMNSAIFNDNDFIRMRNSREPVSDNYRSHIPIQLRHCIKH